MRYNINHDGNAFKHPGHLSLYDSSISDNTTTVIHVHTESAHKVCLKNYASFTAAKHGATKFLRETINEVWFNNLKDANTFFTKVTARILYDLGIMQRNLSQ